MKRILLFAVLLMVQLGFGQTTYFSRATGNWNSAGTWSTVSFASSTNAGTFPVAGDIVNIGGGFTITLTANASCASVTFPASALASTLAIGTNTLTVSGAVVMQAGTAATTRSISIGNSPGTLNAGSITIAGANTATFVNTITVATGTIDVTGDVTFNSGNQSASANLNTTGAATINIGGNLTSGTNNGRLGLNISATWNIRGNYSFAGTLSNNNRMNLILNGIGNQTINGDTRFRRLTINKSSGTATALASIVLNNVGLDVTQGTLDLSTFTHTGAGTLTVSNNAFLRVGGTASLPTFSTYTIDGGSTVEFYGGAQALTATSYGKLTLSGSGGKTFPIGTTTVNGILSIENGANANTFTGTLAYGSAATLQYNTATARNAGAEWIPLFAATGGVVIKNTGVVTFDAGKGFDNNIPLVIDSGASLSTGAFALTLRGNFINNGSFNATNSLGIFIAGNANQSISGFNTNGPVSMNKTTGGIATFTGNVNAGGLSINGGGGRLSLGTGLTHAFSGNWDRQQGALYGGTSTLRISGNVTGSGSSFSSETSTVEFNGGNQNLGSGAVNYYNLVLSGTGSKTFGGITSSSGTWTINTGVKANLGTITTHGAKILYLHGVGPRLDSWGSTGSSAVNRDNAFFDSSSGIINVISAIDNNYASYDNSTGETGGGVVGENTGPLVLTAPNGFVFINTKFSSYGLPFGSYPNYTRGGCHAINSNLITTSLLGNSTVTIPSSGNSFNSTFGDPCSGTIKTYALVATYALPICSRQSPGIITGSLPTGGNGTYSYLWEQSTSLNGTYTTVSGTSNAKDYTPGTLTTTTYYRRTVTSGIYTDATIVIVPVISAPTTPPAITGNCSNSTLSVPASTIPGTYVEWFFGTCNSAVIATGLTYNPTVAGTYFARYTNRCGSTTCGSRNISAPGSNPVSITVTNPTPICSEDLTAGLSYTATDTPTTYTLTWVPNGRLIDRVNSTLPNSTSGTIVIDVPWNTPTGIYTGTIRVRNASNCVSLEKTFSLQVGTSASFPSATPSVCLGNAIPTITHTTAGATGIGTATGLPTGVSASWASNTITISGTPTASGTFNYSIPLTGSCSGTVNATGTIIVNALPSAPSVSKVDASCTVSTGSITITAPTGMNYSINGTDYTNTNGIFTSVAPGTYQVTVRNASGCISPATQVDINPQQLKTWTGTTSTDWHTASNWSPSGVPTDSDCVVIPNATNDPIVTSTAYANTLTVQTGGQLTFENNSSLLQDPSSTTNSNSGEITYKRISSPMKNFDYTYWSSPVSGPTVESPVLGQTAKLLSPNTLADKYFRFDGDVAVNDWVFDDGVMTPGVGFIIRVPKPGTTYPNGENWNTPTYSQPVAFKGVPNNGLVTFDVLADQYNLVGNPYPSAIDADLFMTDTNNADIIYGALYFWTHNTAITQSGSDYVYTADDYATYNITGGTGTGTGGNFAPEVWLDANNNLVVESGEYVDLNGNGFLDKGLEWIDSNNNNIRDVGEWTDLNNNGKVDLQPVEVISNRPLGNIAAGQSFFVGNADPGSFQFTNAMRVSGNNSQFFKQANTKKTTAIEKNRVWLNLTNSGGAFKQLLVGYITGATNDWDNLYDGPSFDGQEFVDFYSVNKGQNLTIQGRALPFEITDVVPLGYRSTIAGTFDISIDNRDGALTNQEIWLEDKKTNTLHELSKGKYTFTAINGVENDRFVLKYTNKTLDTDDNEIADKALIVSVKNKKITLTSSAETIIQVQIFDLLGRKVYDKSKINALEWSITTLPSSEQTLIVKTTLANGAISNKKIIY